MMTCKHRSQSLLPLCFVTSFTAFCACLINECFFVSFSSRYGGWCTLDPPPQIEIANYIWPIIGRYVDSAFVVG